MANETLLFLSQLLKRPLQISALAPSSRALATAMATAIPEGASRVAEFGPGTGRITRAILARGISPDELTLYEMNAEFCAELARRFPGVRIENRPAQEISDAGPGDLDAVVSGLPLLSMPADIRRAIVGAAFAVLRPGGVYIQFTYGSRPSLPEELRAALGLAVRPAQSVLWNLPPAHVHVYSRTGDPSGTA